MSQETQPGELPRVSRIVDVRIPLWGLLCALGTASFFLISMYFTTNQTARDVAELQITVKAGNTQVTTLAGEQALLRFRMDNLEGDMRAIKTQTAPGVPVAPPYTAPTRRSQ